MLDAKLACPDCGRDYAGDDSLSAGMKCPSDDCPSNEKLYKTEFPDFPDADMPAIPKGFVDSSWHNDTCPSIESDTAQLRIWIDYTELGNREFGNIGHRFTVLRKDDDSGDAVLETDDWNEVLEYIDEETSIEAIMKQKGLYILTDHGEPRCGAMFHVMQGDKRIKLAYSMSDARDFILTQKEA